MSDKKYYLSSFFWSTISKISNAILGFISIPLLLLFFGKENYGIISIATACNGYMHLLDMGMNTGAIKFYSQWKAVGKDDLVYRVARTNITFYFIISIINIIGLILLAYFGESLFSLTHNQFLQLRTCLLIIASFSVFSWITTAFNQLLIADKQLDFTMQIQVGQTILKAILIYSVFQFHFSLEQYFFWLTCIISAAIIPYAFRCLRNGLIDSLKPATYWSDFRVVISFSLSIFALSIFQMTATQSRPLVLSMFAENGASAVAEFRIIEVIPQLIIMLGGTFSGIFLPKAAEMVATNDKLGIENFAYKWTRITSAVMNILIMPFILCASEVLAAYVGVEYIHLSKWLIIWCITVLVQMHTTPGNALVLSYGKTKLLVVAGAIGCVCSIAFNIVICKYIGVGSAIIGYFLYVLFIIGLYYIVFYKKLLNLSRRKLFECFGTPTLLGIITLFIVYFLPLSTDMFNVDNVRLNTILLCLIKSSIWILFYITCLFMFKQVNIKMLIKK